MKHLAKCGRCRRWFWSEPPAQLCRSCSAGLGAAAEVLCMGRGPEQFATEIALWPVVECCPFCPDACQCERKETNAVAVV